MPSSHGHPGAFWLCPAPPTPGWSYSQPQLLLSSFSPAASRNGGSFGRLQLPRGGQAGCPQALRLRHVTHVSADKVFHQPQVHSLCSCHVPAQGAPKSSWQEMLVLALAWGNHRVMCNKNKTKQTSPGWFWGDQPSCTCPPQRGLIMGTPKCKTVGTGAVPTPGQGLGTRAELCSVGLGGVLG